MGALNIVAIGEIVWDMLPAGKQLGGAPLNFAFFAQQLGAKAAAISAVGRDELGDQALRLASESGVNLAHVQRNNLPTSRVLITLDEQGIPQYEIVEQVAWDAIEATDRDIALMHTANVVCWGSLAQRSDRSRHSILRMLEHTPKECLKVFDINIRQHYYDREVVELSLRHADILKLNEEELPLIASLLDIEGSAEQQIATLLSRYALRYVVHTHGASFSEIYGSQGEYSHIPTPKVQVADTVGAGDSFTAVLVTSLLQGMTLHEAHALAVKVSAWVCTQHGAINPLPHDML